MAKVCKELKLEKALSEHMDGKLSIDKAAKMVGITVYEIMDEAATNGIKIEESIEDLRKGVKLLLES